MADLRTSLSRMTPQERDIVIRILLAEAGNQGQTGQQAVAAVIGNRAAQSGLSPRDVVMARNQFEPWNTSAGRSKMAGYSPSSPGYQQAGSALDAAASGNDPTGGATHFYSPKAQAALGRSTPSWARGQQGTDIGDHRFYNLGYQAGFAQNRHGIPPRPPGDIPQPQQPRAAEPSALLPDVGDPTSVSALIAPFKGMGYNRLDASGAGAQQNYKAPMTALQGGYNVSPEMYDPKPVLNEEPSSFDPIKKIAKEMGLSETETENFRLGLALGGSDPLDGWGGGKQGGFSSGGFGAEGVG